MTPSAPPAFARPGVGRYAPSTTGSPHPGTLLSALLAWLDARSIGDRFLLRLEDLDPDRCTPAYAREMTTGLAWLGLEWDVLARQSDFAADHASALDRLAQRGVLYPCSCSRAQLRARLGEHPTRSPDGGIRYDNHCRGRAFDDRGTGGWRNTRDALRVQLPDGVLDPLDLGGEDLHLDPVAAFGDPVVRRRDGAVAYHLACVVDDAESGVTRVVRGRDIATSTATQVALQRLLGYETPAYRHHLLLVERRDRKLAKLHGSVGLDALRTVYDAPALCGVLAYAGGMRERPEPATPQELLAEFEWEKVARDDRVVHWSGTGLQVAAPQSQTGPTT